MGIGHPGRHGPVVPKHAQIDLQTTLQLKQDPGHARTHPPHSVVKTVEDDQKM